MSDHKFKIPTRLESFIHRLRKFNFKSWNLFIYLLGWLVAFFATITALESGTIKIIIVSTILGYFWNKLIDEFFNKIETPIEVLLVSILLTYMVQFLWMHLNDVTITNWGIDNYPNILSTAIQIFLLAPLLILFSLILLQNSQGKKGIIIEYIFLGIIGIYLVNFSDRHLWYLFQIFLLFLLYRRTSWVEELSKKECWVYFVIIMIIYINFKTVPYASGTQDFTTEGYSWYFIPKVLSHFIQLYLLGVLIKIPFVIVYHHASLTRKFRIAGWLQSSLPQLIQLFLLLLVFYFFIGSWQAGNLKSAIIDYAEKIEIDHYKNDIQVYEFEFDRSTNEINFSEYNITLNTESLSRQGVIELTNRSSPIDSKSNFFIFYKTDFKKKGYIRFINIDSTFLNEISRNLPLLMASRLMSYPFQINQWDSLLYKIRIWEWEESNKYQNIRIFPFGITPHKSNRTKSIMLNQFTDRKKKKLPDISFLEPNSYTSGRIYLPLFTENATRQGYWAFEIVINPNQSFFTSPVMRLLLFWIIIYLIINALIIRRVVKFGNQIYQMIIQKFSSLKSGIRQISSGNLSYKIKLEGEDEFVELANRFNQMGEDLQKKISELREKDRLEYELNIAREVQLSLLPRHLPKVQGYQIVASIRTATEVGGDFYDVLPLEENRYLFIIGDVSGKGTSAAFYMAQCISLFRFSRQFSHQPRDILLRLNRYFSDPAIDRQIFVTGIIGLLDAKSHSIQMIRAGHYQPLILPSDPSSPITEIESSGLGLGLERSGDIFERLLQKKVVKLKKGDMLILFTDGVVEATRLNAENETKNSKTDFYGEEQLKELLEKLRGKTADKVMSSIINDIEKFYEDSPLIDDFTLLIIQRE